MMMSVALARSLGWIKVILRRSEMELIRMFLPYKLLSGDFRAHIVQHQRNSPDVLWSFQCTGGKTL